MLKNTRAELVAYYEDKLRREYEKKSDEAETRAASAISYWSKGDLSNANFHSARNINMHRCAISTEYLRDEFINRIRAECVEKGFSFEIVDNQTTIAIYSSGLLALSIKYDRKESRAHS